MTAKYNVNPDKVSWNGVLFGFAQIGQPEKCTELFQRMVRMSLFDPCCKPDTALFNVLLLSHANSDAREAPIHAEELLDHMERLNKAGTTDVVPDAKA